MSQIEMENAVSGGAERKRIVIVFNDISQLGILDI